MDLLIRGGTLVDGTGAAPRPADIVVENGMIKSVGGPDTVCPFHAKEVIDADGMIVTPGFVDLHTHYDGQATWDDVLAPSAHHGVTTAVMGNCGVGFAPVRPGDRQYLIELMEGVEDIPGTALTDGIKWAWESFPEYLDALEKTPRAINIATQVPHGALRLFVFGKDSKINAPATPKQIQQMADLTREAVSAGAMAFSTNRIAMHMSLNGESVPGTFAKEDEVLALVKAAQEGGSRILQVVPQGLMGEDPSGFDHEIDFYRKISLETGSSVYFTIAQNNMQPELWIELMNKVDKANSQGAKLVAAIANRPGGILMSWESFSIFMDRPSYLEIAHLPLTERVRELREPKRRAKILGEEPQSAQLKMGKMVVMSSLGAIYPLDSTPILEPDPDTSIARRIERTGLPAEEVLYDAMCELAENAAVPGETGFLHIYMGNYAHGNLDAVDTMMRHPNTIIGAADGGAHVNVICDASYTSFMLQHWVRDRTRGQRWSLEEAVRKISGDPAALYGLTDRGVIAEGKRADFNIIDMNKLQLRAPRVVRDLPSGSPRLLQHADGYVATLVGGVVTFKNGVDTGARPGKLVRGGSH
jgi:N-acyl-D-aspartate/D-glutamate deacylase